MVSKQIKALIIVVIIYGFTICGCTLLYPILPFGSDNAEDILVKLVILDLIATVFIFLMSTIFKNSSLYDPYWSVAPMVISIAFMLLVDNVNPFSVLLVVLICLWGVRLTINWAIGFKRMNHQDWRYVMLKEKFPKLYPLINLFGIHLMPTIVVMVGLLPALNFIGDVLKPGYEPSLMTIVGYLVVFAAIIIETIADLQLFLFKRYPSNDGLVMTRGLWKNSRHPNYFGECLFWFGLFLVHFSFKNANPILVFAPLLVFLLFEFISIPMMDKRQLSKKPAYNEYKARTNPMLPIFPPKGKEE